MQTRGKAARLSLSQSPQKPLTVESSPSTEDVDDSGFWDDEVQVGRKWARKGGRLARKTASQVMSADAVADERDSGPVGRMTRAQQHIQTAEAGEFDFRFPLLSFAY